MPSKTFQVRNGGCCNHHSKQKPSWLARILQWCCLRSNYSLRRQVIAGYGMTAFFTIFLVILMATTAALWAGSGVKRESTELFQTQLDAILQESGILTGDILDKKMNSLRGSASLLAEIVRDRIVGYPYDGWENDTHIPFPDRDTGFNIYPLHAELLPRDWMVQTNLEWGDFDGLREHIQERADYGELFFENFAKDWNTESAMFTYQGNCDPNQNDPDQIGYYPFCSDEFNDASLGGKINPTSTLAPLEQKAADLGVFLKAIFEAEAAALTVAVIFSNSGAGASVIYPAQPFSFRSAYESAGCEWMRATNPLTGRPYGSKAEINRCTPEGTRASAREYNGLERAWCSDQALHPGETRIYGPYSDATRDSWRLTIGKAVFDRLTREFIGCIALDLSLIQAEELLEEVNEGVPSDMVLTKPDGTVVVGILGSANETESTLTPKLWETSFIDEETYRELTDDLAFWEEEIWDIETAISTYDFSVKSNGKYYTVFPSPIPPDEYDPNYKPDFLIFGSINADVQDETIDEIAELIDRDVTEFIIVSVALGAVGLGCMLSVVAIVAHFLTQPLKWIESKSWEIVNHSDTRVSDSFRLSLEDDEDKSYDFFSFIPKTEVQELVSEFRNMISGFSGEDASRVSVPRHTETKNIVTWKDEFLQFYTLSPTLKHKLKEESIRHRSVTRRMSSSAKSSISQLDTADFSKFDDSDIHEEKHNLSFRSIEWEQKPTVVRENSMISITSTQKMSWLDTDRSEITSTQINLGSNIHHSADRENVSVSDDIKLLKSPLFWNLFFWIVLPLLVSIVAIMIIAGVQILTTFPQWIKEANSTSFDLEKENLQSSATLIVKHIEHVFDEPLLDLHMISRLSGWLLFGAVNRSGSFTDIEMEFVEECKYYENIQECPFEMNNTRSPCFCEWNDPWGRLCDIEDGNNLTSTSDPRYVQRMWYMNQIHAGNESFPVVDYSPESTSWYTNSNRMQGSDKGSNAEGYSTAYDRLRVSSALSAIIIPIYNYGSSVRGEGSTNTAMSGYISFEAEGEYYGYDGCNYDVAGYSQFQSSEENSAYLVRPDLCPLGKFGYDPRCRSWYAEAKERALDHNASVYITPPYQFANTDEIGNTAVSSLIDPKSGEFVGNNLIDFSTTDIAKIASKISAKYYAVVIPNAKDGQNLVASSHFSSKTTPKPITDVIMQFDPANSSFVRDFNKVMLDMGSEGKEATCDLYRTNRRGEVEQFCCVHEPVYYREVRPVQSDDFGRGTEVSTKFLYSVVLFEPTKDLSTEYTTRSHVITRALQNTAILYILMTALITFICIIVTAMISSSITRPMIQLLQTVKQVNAGRIEDDMPPLTGGSREVHRVHTSFAKLYKVVRLSNSAFFLGDLKLAHHTAQDALQLFQKIGDSKAIAIANNNMGNLLLAWMVECRHHGSCLTVDDDENGSFCCMVAAIKHYDKAVQSGKKDFDNASGDAEKCQYAQQLADRHFNRAMCLLYTADDPCASSNAKETALDDLFLTRQYDQGVKEYMLHSKTLFKHSDVIFERYLRRLNGLAVLIDIDPDVWNVWDIYDLADQADLMLQAAWNKDDAPIFHNVKQVGRLQELESAVTGVELSAGKGNDALLLATRMLVEDEFILDSAFIETADCLLQYLRNSDTGRTDEDDDHGSDDSNDSFDAGAAPPRDAPRKGWSETSTAMLRQELKRMRKPGMQRALDTIGRTFVLCIELQGHWNGRRSFLADLRNACTSFYEENCRSDDSMGMVTFAPSSGDLRRLSPSRRSQNEDSQRAEIEAATTGVACSRFVPALEGAIEMALSAEASTSCDVCLLYVSDGGAYERGAYARLRKTLEQRRGKGGRRGRHPPISPCIDLVVLGLGADPSSGFAENCKGLALATHSRTSFYLDVDVDVREGASQAPSDSEALAEAFREAGAAIHAGTSFAGIRLQRALTMQKF